MSLYDSEFSQEDNSESSDNLEEEIKECKAILENGYIYNSIERIEDLIQDCIDFIRFEDGLYFTNKLLEIFPYNSELWLKKGILLNGLMKFEEAIECFDKALSLNPNDAETLVDKSAAEENMGLYQQAEESLRRVLELDPENEDAYFSLGLLYQRQ
ncbi:MAG: tetratricopeptide repeat protein, partial [Candidatus Bathyarchaeia archaeon]